MREGGKKGTRDKEWTAAYIKGKSRMENSAYRMLPFDKSKGNT